MSVRPTRDLAATLRRGGGVRVRQGTVDAVNADGTIDVTLGGSTVVVPSVVTLGGITGAAGDGVWLLQWDRDLLAIGGAAGGWTAPTLANSWVDYGGGYETAGYRRDPGGIVRLKGVVKNGTAAATLFTLPVGYRPDEVAIYIVKGRTSGGTYGDARVDVDPSGAVSLSANAGISPGGAAAWVSLAGITFPAV